MSEAVKQTLYSVIISIKAMNVYVVLVLILQKTNKCIVMYIICLQAIVNVYINCLQAIVNVYINRLQAIVQVL